MRTAAVMFAALVLALPAAAVAQGYGGQGNDQGGDGGTLACSSSSGQRQWCQVPPGWQTVVMVRQLSRAACDQGRTWDFDGHDIWVSDGCRGEFATTDNEGRPVAGDGAPPPGGGETVVCESQGSGTQQCPLPSNWRGVRIAEQLSHSDCVQGRDWGYIEAAQSVWVDHGCRARFAAAGYWEH